MLRIMIVIVGLMLAAGLGFSAPQSGKAAMHKVIFEVNVDGAEQWKGIVTNIENLQKALGPANSRIEVVTHGKGVGLLLKTDTAEASRLKQLFDSGVVFMVCENTMRRKNIAKEDLLTFAKTVDSGIAEVVRKQEAHYSYIKAGG